jgi:hypothetical protein
MRKRMIILTAVILAASTGTGRPQQLVLPPLTAPGSVSRGKIPVIVTPQLMGRCKMIFSGFAPGIALPVLSREETDPSGRGLGKYDRLDTFFTGSIMFQSTELYSFVDKLAEELVRVEPVISSPPGFPIGPITLDLEIKAASSPTFSIHSQDAGIYTATLVITLIQFEQEET